MSQIHEPKCPSCSVVGTNNIVKSNSELTNGKKDPWFEIAHCANCGHVYGVFTKTLKNQSS